MPHASHRSVASSFLQFALFLSGCAWLLLVWVVSAHAAQGIADRLNLPVLYGLLQQLVRVFLLLVGFATLDWVSSRMLSVRSANALPRRSTAGQEWLRGAALGWGILLVIVIPMGMVGALHPQFWFAPRTLSLAFVSVLELALLTLALELSFRGYLFARLIQSVGHGGATVLLSVLYAMLSLLSPYHSLLSVSVTFLMAVLFSMAYLRTHALWFGWGLHFAWSVATTVLLGLPLASDTTYSSVVSTSVSGPVWLTGGFYGPGGSAWTAFAVLAAMALLYRITRGYAWEYTHAPIVPMGHAVTIAPPPEHIAMEASVAAVPAPLVQILATTSTSSSVLPEIDAHLRGASVSDKAQT